jgi:pyridoxal phosphate-dependent aminotransferase EpsN
MSDYRILLSAPEAGDDERELLLDALDSNWLAPLGPHVDAFEREIAQRCGVGHAAALSSGTAALELALRLVGVQPGDVVLAPSLTFVASVAPVVHLGATPVFVDSEPASWNVDPDLVAEELRRRAARGTQVKAVIAVDLYGQCADYTRLEPLCAEYGVPLVADAAEALGASWADRPAGSFGACGVLSFNGNKIITSSGGGMLVSDDAALIERARYLSTQARSPAPHYEHIELGFNYRMSNVCAALGRGQLHGLDRKIARRRAIFARYAEALADLPGIAFMPEPSEGAATRWLTLLVIDPALAGTDRETVRTQLAARGIEARPAWKPMHLQPVFAGAAMRGGAVCERIFREGLCLPSGSGLTDADIDEVIERVRATLSAR